jgi:hypothetical protein
MPADLGSAPPMTVGTANDALRDLMNKSLKRSLAPDERSDVRRLRANVIKVENHAVCLAAIDARRRTKDRRHIGRVSGAPRTDSFRRRPARGGAPAVAASTHDLAQRDLLVKSVYRGAVVG